MRWLPLSLAIAAIVLLLAGVLPRWWFDGSDGRLTGHFGLRRVQLCAERGCISIGYDREWIDNGYRTPGEVAHFQTMLWAARFAFAGALATCVLLAAAATLAIGARPRAVPVRASLAVLAGTVSLVVAAAAIGVVIYRPTFPEPDMRYFSVAVGPGVFVTIAGVLCTLAAAWTLPRR